MYRFLRPPYRCYEGRYSSLLGRNAVTNRAVLRPRTHIAKLYVHTFIPASAPASLHARLREKFGSFTPYLGHGAYIIGFALYATTDMYSLRVLAVAGSSLAVCFNYLQPVPITIPVAWNIIYIGINLYQIVLLLSNKQRDFTEREIKLYDYFRKYVTLEQYSALLKSGGTWKKMDKGGTILRKGDPGTVVLFLYKGRVKIKPEGGSETVIGPGNMLGEIAFVSSQTEKKYSATVEAVDRITYLEFTYDQLRTALAENPSLSNAGAQILNHSLIQRLLQKERDENEQVYSLMLKVALSNNSVTSSVKSVLRDYREASHLSAAIHEKLLLHNDWTIEEFEKGERNQKCR